MHEEVAHIPEQVHRQDRGRGHAQQLLADADGVHARHPGEVDQPRQAEQHCTAQVRPPQDTPAAALRLGPHPPTPVGAQGFKT